MADRPLSVIATEVYEDWEIPNYAAEPYLRAMADLTSVNDNYAYDSGRDIVRYFLSNASSWRGPVARRVKAELKGML